MSKKRGRKPNNRVQQHMPQRKVNGAKEHMADKDEKKIEERRVPVDQAAYLAAQLHEANANLIEERTRVLHKDKLLLGKDEEILKLRDENLLLRKEKHNLTVKLASIEEKKLQEVNSSLLTEHKLKQGVTIHKDEATGETYVIEKVESPPAGSDQE